MAYLFASTEFAQILRIPLLVEHFVEHKHEDESITLYEFFVMHYLDEQHLDGDYDKDMRLPFKTLTSSTTSIVDFIPSLNLSIIPKSENKEIVGFNPYEDLFIENIFISSIWQPPRFS